MPLEMIWRTTSTPLTSSPWIPAVIKTVGPGFLERSIITGTSIINNTNDWKIEKRFTETF